MTPKEKAEELINIFERKITKGDVDGVWVTEHLIKYFHYTAKQCALIAVELLIDETFIDFYVTNSKPYWKLVKTEIEAL